MFNQNRTIIVQHVLFCSMVCYFTLICHYKMKYKLLPSEEINIAFLGIIIYENVNEVYKLHVLTFFRGF